MQTTTRSDSNQVNSHRCDYLVGDERCSGEVVPLTPEEVGYESDSFPPYVRVYRGCSNNPDHSGILCDYKTALGCGCCSNEKLVCCLSLKANILRPYQLVLRK